MEMLLLPTTALRGGLEFNTGSICTFLYKACIFHCVRVSESYLHTVITVQYKGCLLSHF